MVVTATLLRDTLFFVKDLLDGNVTDPISASRASNQAFIMTSYPSRPVRYPLITIKDLSTDALITLGFQAEAQQMFITLEIRAWGRTTKERDEMFQVFIFPFVPLFQGMFPSSNLFPAV